MKLRRIASLTGLLSGLLLALSSIVLYLAPQGRVAYWSDWRLLGMDKDQWGSLHINLGFLFVLAVALHTVYNWTPILTYLKNRSRELKILTPEFNLALGLTLAVAVGTYLELPPVRWVIDLNERIKAAAADRHGEPPYGHAELSSLDSFLARAGMTPQALKGLEARGIRFDSGRQTLVEVARANGITPKAVYEALQAAAPEGGARPMPEAAPPGTGRMTVAAVCDAHGLPVADAIAALQEAGIAARPEMTLKAVADAAGRSAVDIYGILRRRWMEGAKGG